LTPFLIVLGIGFLLGMRHATDPDHVVAVSTIVARTHSVRRATLIGAVWGLGHSITIFLVGCAIILFGIVVSPRLGLAMELGVAVMLVLLGLLNLGGWLRPLHRWLPHHDAADAHSHAVPANGAQSATRYGSQVGTKSASLWRALVIGIVHGLAGSAAVGLLVMAAIRDPRWAAGYLAVFGAGTIAGMVIITSVIAAPLAYAGARVASFGKILTTATGVLSLSFGLFLIYQIGFVSGLFSANPSWLPR
jgi:high-affinity nickel permease